jgi:metallo-beta-lactamase class B
MLPSETTSYTMPTIILTITFLFSMTNIFGQSEAPKLKLSHLTGNFYIYTTYNTYEGNKTPANGMFVITDQGVVLLDTPWDTTQFQLLLDSIKLNHHKNVMMYIATHWHPDRTGGLEYYKVLKTFHKTGQKTEKEKPHYITDTLLSLLYFDL